MSTYNAISYGSSVTLTAENLLGWTGASLTSATTTQLTLQIRDGGVVAFPGDYDLILTGTFTVAAGRVFAGTVTSIEGRIPATGTALSELTGLSVDLTGLITGGGNFLLTPDIPAVFANTDTFNGGANTDTLRGFGGGDNLFGNGGDDVFLYQAGDSATNDVINGGADTDTIRLLASTDLTSAFSIQNVERLDFAQSSGTVVGTFKVSQIGIDATKISTIDGSAGTDQLAINNPNSTTFIDVSAVTFTNWTSSLDLLTFNGVTIAENITGSVVRDSLNGGGANDTIRGGGDADILNGDAGNDIFTYFAADAISAEIINGGADTDEIQIKDAGTFDFGSALISNIENLNFEQASGTATATLTAAQLLGIGSVNQSVNADALVVNGSAIDLSALTFTSWGNGGDTITLNGTGAADTLTGTVEADIINGGIGADTIRGGLDRDELNGSAGNDVFVVVATNEVVSGEVLNGGSDIDTLRIDGTGTFSLNNATFSNTEILDFNQSSGTATVQISGSRIGTFSTVDGSAGTDILTVVDAANAVSTSANLSGITFTNWIDGTDFIQIFGTQGNDTLIGSGRNDSISGDTGNNTMRGGLGADTLAGANGDDTFEYLAGSEIVSGESLSGAGGFNTVKLLGSGIFDFRDAAFEVLAFDRLDFSQSTGATTAHFIRNILGNPELVNIVGSAAADTLIIDADGGSGSVATLSFTNWTAGIDTITLNGQANIQNSLSGSSEADLILGANLNDNLSGGSGDDTMTGGGGADQLRGDGGNDLFLFATGDGVAGEAIEGGAGTDVLRINAGASVDFSGANITGVETIDFTNGSAITLNGNQLRAGGTFTSITGNNGLAQNLTVAIGSGIPLIDLSGVTFTDWTSGTDTITLRVDGTSSNGGVTGSSQADLIIGSALSDLLSGGAGSDTIIGDAGADGMNGGDGDDIFFVDTIGDQVSENSANGFDIVVSDVNFTLSDNIEQLVLRGGATIGIGNDGANFLYGGDSGLSLNLDGRGGDDIFFSGLAGHNTLSGGAGIDTLQLFGGNNQANGGTGADIYFTFTDTDIISEAGGDGSDTVFANWNFTMGAGIEQLLLFGNATAAVGSADDNVMFGNSTSGAVSLSGLGGSDVLFGGSFNDTLVGGAGNDQLFGLDGINVLEGGIDNDIYYLASLNNTLTELSGEGFDTIISDLAFSMASNTEQAIIFGTATGITGNDGDNFIFNVGTAASTLAGGLGNDYLRGSDQSDVHDGGFGDDQLDLRGGGDDRLFYATGNMGNDIAFGFDADAAGGQDLIDLTGRGYSAASIGADISIGSVAGDALVTFNTGSLAGTSLRLFGVASGVVEATDFVF